jgi:3-hydroxyacyl-[acyl-carrier-protein] dehydratase
MSDRSDQQMGYSELQHWLRHRFPMVLIDRVVGYESGKSITALTALSGTSDWAQGHFPGRAIYPGSHIIQAFSQTAILLLQLSSPLLSDDEMTVVSSIEAKFASPAVPGDLLLLSVTLNRVCSNVFFFQGSAARGADRVARIRVNIARRQITAFGRQLW